MKPVALPACRLLACLFGLLAANWACAARDLAFPGIIGSDDRKLVEIGDPTWNAIGKIQAAGADWTTWCTGTLIASNLVVTSARCLLDPDGTLIPAEDVHFLAGVNRDKWLAHSTGACVRSLAAQISPSTALHKDVAVIVLRESIEVAPVRLADDNSLAEATAVTHAGYGRDRPYRLSANSSCHVLSSGPEVVTTDCDTHFGQIGGSLLVYGGQSAPRIAGVVVGGSEHRSTFAISVDKWRRLALETDCE